MCSNIGVDPLASNKGMWAQLLGFGDFYYELGVQVVEGCLSTRPLNGGLIDLAALCKIVQVLSHGLLTSYTPASLTCACNCACQVHGSCLAIACHEAECALRST